MSTRINIRNGRVELGFPQGRGPKGDKGDQGDPGELLQSDLDTQRYHHHGPLQVYSGVDPYGEQLRNPMGPGVPRPIMGYGVYWGAHPIGHYAGDSQAGLGTPYRDVRCHLETLLGQASVAGGTTAANVYAHLIATITNYGNRQLAYVPLTGYWFGSAGAKTFNGGFAPAPRIVNGPTTINRGFYISSNGRLTFWIEFQNYHPTVFLESITTNIGAVPAGGDIHWTETGIEL